MSAHVCNTKAVSEQNNDSTGIFIMCCLNFVFENILPWKVWVWVLLSEYNQAAEQSLITGSSCKIEMFFFNKSDTDLICFLHIFPLDDHCHNRQANCNSSGRMCLFPFGLCRQTRKVTRLWVSQPVQTIPLFFKAFCTTDAALRMASESHWTGNRWEEKWHSSLHQTVALDSDCFTEEK